MAVTARRLLSALDVRALGSADAEQRDHADAEAGRMRLARGST